MDCVVAPVLHVFPVALDEVKVTLPPAQNVVGPLADMVGAAGNGFTVIVLEPFAETQPLPLVTFTVYVPAALTVMDCVVAPVLHVFPVALEEVKVTLPPAQNVNGPLAEIVGVAGSGLTVTVADPLAELQPPLK